MKFSSRSPFRAEDFHLDGMMRYSQFAPRLYNLCCALGFEPGRIMPSRAFCSDESQGFPTILIAKHFGTYPFNHGRVGGIVAAGRHGPHAHHGEDLLIIQASHVGYDPETGRFGSYRRLQTAEHCKSTACGKIGAVLERYQQEYDFARRSILLGREGELRTITLDNQLLDDARSEGLLLDLDALLRVVGGKRWLLRTQSTSRVYAAAESFYRSLPEEAWPERGTRPIGDDLAPELFHFKHQVRASVDIEYNLIASMPWIVSAREPLLVAAQVNTQMEFDRTYRTLVKSREYRGKNLLFVACLHIDVSPSEGQVFPLTKCVPWAAYQQCCDGSARVIEQAELLELLLAQDEGNPNQIDLEAAIEQMVGADEVRIEL